MSRYTDVPFTRVVAAGATATFAVAIPYNRVNVAKLRVVPSNAGEDWQLSIHKNISYDATSLVYGTVVFAGSLVDPVLASGGLIAEKNQGFVCAYEDATSSSQMYIKIYNAGAVSQTFDGVITVDTTYGTSVTVSNVPSGLQAKAFASGLVITSGVLAAFNNASIDLGEFRAIFVSGQADQPYYDLRTVAEGGSFVPDGTTKIQTNVDSADADGAQYIFTSTSAGRWYYAWRLRNSIGWSNWTDGNSDPVRVTQFVDTRNATTPDSGPPADWEVWLEDGPASNTVVVHAVRPRTNGDLINWMYVQLLDADVGSWCALLDGPDPDNIKLDGRGNHYTLDSSLRNVISDDDVAGWGTAAIGDLVLLDVRGGGATWDEQYCQWATVQRIVGTNLYVNGFFRPQAYTNMRLVIVKPPWAWTTGGFGVGMWPTEKKDYNLFVGDTKTREFVTTTISVDPGVTNPEARVWFENTYSRADNNITHSTGKMGFQTVRTFEDFTDSRYWIPLYPITRWGTLTIDPITRHATIAAVTPRDSTVQQYGWIGGVKARFTLFPDNSGTIIFRARFENCYIPQYAGADSGDTSKIGIFWRPSHIYYSQMLEYGFSIGNYQKNADMEMLLGGLAGTDSIAIDSHFSGTGYSNFLAVARPAAGWTVDLKVGYSSPSVSTNYGIAVTTAAVQINDGGYTTLTGVDKGYFGDYGDILTYGITPMCLFFESLHGVNRCLPDWYGTLTEFEVIQGIIVPGRILQEA